MSERAKFDFLVIGGGLPGLAAVCCAARRGADAAMALTGFESPIEGRVAEPPAGLWRLLDLHQYDFEFEAPPTHVSLFEGDAIATGEDAARDSRRLAKREATLEHLWPAYSKDMARAMETRETNFERFVSANALLDDYFGDEALKTHLLSTFVAPFGLAGDEAGSAEALFAAGLRRQRSIDAATYCRVLSQAAESAGAEIIPDKLLSFGRGENKNWRASFETGRDIRAKTAMASCAHIVEPFGVSVSMAGSPLARRRGLNATIRLKLDKKPKVAAEWKRAVFHLAGDRENFRSARDAMIEGALPETPPVTFEVNGKEIIAHAYFCPSRLVVNGEAREWTGQDRQVLGRNVASVIEKQLGVTVDVSEVRIGPDVEAGLKRRDFSIPVISAPAPSLDPVNAAALLAWELTERE